MMRNDTYLIGICMCYDRPTPSICINLFDLFGDLFSARPSGISKTQGGVVYRLTRFPFNANEYYRVLQSTVLQSTVHQTTLRCMSYSPPRPLLLVLPFSYPFSRNLIILRTHTRLS